MPLKPKDMERLLLADGWILKNHTGSHRHYIHPYKLGKVTIPFHTKNIPRGTECSIRKQAGIQIN